ncbi:MAG: hypothetical protein RL641_907 [Candidatus Parcubacteria bacterium]
MENELKLKLKNLPMKKVAFILFSDNTASEQFVKMKERFAERVGISTTRFKKEVRTTEDAVIFINNLDDTYDGIVVQLPLPLGLDTEQIISAIPLDKDIDLLSAAAMDTYRMGEGDRVPPVAKAVWEIIKLNNVNLENKRILVVGNGRLVGAPVAAMLAKEKIPYIQIRRSTSIVERLAEIQNADIIITGVGEPHFITPNVIKKDVILIDAGTSEQSGKLAGDIHPACVEKASLMTPVPGGVGPITVASLFWNVLWGK